MKKFISLLLVVIVMATCMSFVACKEKKEYYDTITKTLKLTKSYEGKSFMTDGIGKATVELYTDGDTTRFKTGNDIVVIRYYCVDTPESTGGSDKWGKSASVFVKNKLSNATEIVLESSTGGVPETDNYNVRYLGYVWYKTADYGEFKLLNLELMENGYSLNKASSITATPYYSYFKKAEEFARKSKLRMHGDDDDPLYRTEPIEITLKEFWEHTNKYYFEDIDAGEKICFVAYLESLTISSTSTHTYQAVYYDPETGEKTAPINVFTQYASNPASTNLRIGCLYKITGVVQKYFGEYQVSGIYYDKYAETEIRDGTVTVQNDYYLTFNSSVNYITQFSRTLYTDVTVKSSSVENNVLTIVGEAYQVIKSGNKLSDKPTEFKFTVKVSDGFTNILTEGKKFSVKGYQLVYNSHEIIIPSYKDIIIK